MGDRFVLNQSLAAFLLAVVAHAIIGLFLFFSNKNITRPSLIGDSQFKVELYQSSSKNNEPLPPQDTTAFL